MSRVSLILVLFLSLLTGCPASSPNVRQDRPDSTRTVAPAAQDPNLDVANLPDRTALMVGGILRDVTTARRLDLLAPLVARGIDREAHAAYIKAEASREKSVRALRMQSLCMKAVGSIPPDMDLMAMATSFMTDEVAGYYDWERKTLFVCDWSLVEDHDAVLAHEMTHVLQDQHFDLARISDPIEGISEPFSAGLAVAEGDAMATMAATLGVDPVRNSRIMYEMADAMQKELAGGDAKDGTGVSSTVPNIVEQAFMWYYIDGTRYVAGLLGRGGWDAVNEALRNPPLSTEQILHPSKTGVPDYPMNVRMSPDIVPDATWVGSEILGEASLRLLFGQVMPPAQVLEAASGWDGDRFGLWIGPGGETIMVVASVWDSAMDARTAADAFNRLAIPPTSLQVEFDKLVAVWGLAPEVSAPLATRVLSNMDFVEIRSWDDWLKEAEPPPAP